MNECYGTLRRKPSFYDLLKIKFSSCIFQYEKKIDLFPVLSKILLILLKTSIISLRKVKGKR